MCLVDDLMDLMDDTAELTASCAAGDWHAEGTGAAEVRRITRETYEHARLGREHAVTSDIVLGGAAADPPDLPPASAGAPAEPEAGADADDGAAGRPVRRG
ncbi:MAG TPA: hypothetical protein VK586_02550 [Streptosporangiaceae bacterium]|nr:hypothetical protein [Streptosporangiaceae bacterium]